MFANLTLLSIKDHTSCLTGIETCKPVLFFQNAPNVSVLTKDLHIWPDFHGNRSPIADPTLKGMISGLVMDPSVSNLALMYLATMQSVAYGTKHIVQQMERSVKMFLH